MHCNILHSGQADTRGNSQGVMFESVLKTSCEIIEFGWSKDRAPVDTFILGLATCIRVRNDYDEEVSLSIECDTFFIITVEYDFFAKFVRSPNMLEHLY